MYLHCDIFCSYMWTACKLGFKVWVLDYYECCKLLLVSTNCQDEKMVLSPTELVTIKSNIDYQHLTNHLERTLLLLEYYYSYTHYNNVMSYFGGLWLVHTFIHIYMSVNDFLNWICIYDVLKPPFLHASMAFSFSILLPLKFLGAPFTVLQYNQFNSCLFSNSYIVVCTISNEVLIPAP